MSRSSPVTEARLKKSKMKYKTKKYTHYVQNESHLGIDKIEGNTKDELIASLFEHISSTSGYHKITKKEANNHIKRMK